MMLTVEEANRKVCPFMSGPVSRSFNDGTEDDAFTLRADCLGSRCMAWRVGKRPNPRTILHDMSAKERHEIIENDLDDPPRPEGVPEAYIFGISPQRAFWIEDDASCEARRKGYCGLVGAKGRTAEESA
ncbi:hypothetical protein LJC48_01060 [Desulfovibrio sp. OttesenSCG-928-C06]|nr:hypothetical protein [Desulfovibrio sp. OttesenSCG-928-C06]